jgi:AcrR family transcriptional regulator
MVQTEKLQKKNPKGRGPQRHTKDDWIKIALETLIAEGVENVKVMVLSAKLGTARSSFYW